MTMLLALIPTLVAVIIFVGTFRLQPPRISRNAPRPAATRPARLSATRTPVPVGALRRSARPSDARSLRAS